MEKLTPKEQEVLKALTAKAKRIERAEKQFLTDADARKAELLERWGMSDELDYIASVYYGITKDELRSFITSEQQVNFYKRTHGNA